MTDEPMHVRAPFTDAQIESLNGYQSSGVFHEFTCPNRNEPGHHDLGLRATTAGWVCDECEYIQDWAWQWMADSSWIEMRKSMPWLYEDRRPGPKTGVPNPKATIIDVATIEYD